jgi:hypothetical protein
MHSCVQDGCPEGQLCDTKTEVCIVPREVGSGCQRDSECAGGFCVHPGDFGLSVELKDNRCASACCGDSDCASGSVCVVGNSGSRLCLPANIASRPSSAAGDRCARDDECASGLCDRSRCATRCFADAACRTGACTLSPGSVSKPRLWLCGDPVGREAGGSACASFDTVCRSGFCAENFECGQPCGRNGDCAADEVCGYRLMRQPFSTQTWTVSACEARATAASDRLCCTSADCGEAQLCAPKSIDSNGSKLWIMTCR